MKKILFLILFLLSGICYAASDWDSAQSLKRVSTIGSKILKANNVNYVIEFKVSDTDDINAYANINKEIYVYRGLLELVDNDEELAGVISHEMGHIINGHCAKQSVLGTGIALVTNIFIKNKVINTFGQYAASSKISRNDEYEADLTGVDLMTKAGYNPLAMISLLNKISQNYVDILQSHPSGDKRLLNIYDYVEYNYSDKLEKGYNTESYNNAIAKLKPQIEERKNSQKLTEEYVEKQEKLWIKKEKRAKKMQGTNSVWDGYYSTLLNPAYN